MTIVAALSALLALSTVAALSLLVDGARRRDGTVVVAGPLLLFALLASSDLADEYGIFAGAPVAAGLIRGAFLLIAPSIWLAAAALATPPRRARPRDITHALPAVVVAVALAIVFAEYGVASPQAEVARKASEVVFAVATASYLAAAGLRLRFSWRRLRNLVSYRGGVAERRLDFALALIGLPFAMLAVELALGLGIELGDGLRFALGLLRMAFVMGLAVVAILARPLAEGAHGGDDELEVPPTPYARSPLDKASAQRIAAKLEAVMGERRVYREAFLTLSDLSGAIGVPEHRLSQVLNRHLGVNFFDYVNAWRVGEAAQLLRSETDRSVLSIAEAVGFNSKSTFNAAFRRHKGVTPSGLRRGAGAPKPP